MDRTHKLVTPCVHPLAVSLKVNVFPVLLFHVLGEEDLLAQCSQGLAHGVLVTLRYITQDTDWATLSNQQAQGVHQFLEDLLPALENCSKLCMTILSDQVPHHSMLI